MKITQIATGPWRTEQGDVQYNVMGLGEDSKVYRWSKKKGKWELWVSETRKTSRSAAQAQDNLDTEIF